jgi:tetratricopeptide (TPR) repeat protein
MKFAPFIFIFFFSGISLPHPVFAQVLKYEKPAPEGVFRQEEEDSEYQKGIIANDLFEKAFKASRDNEKIRLYKKALELNPNNADAYNNLGIIYKKLKMYDQAFSSYKKALKIPGYLTPEHAHNNLGVLYKELERYEEAIEQFQKAITISSSFAKAWNNLGIVYKKEGMFDKAAECFQKALKLQPNYVQAEENLKNVWKLPKEKSLERKKIETLYTNALKLFHEGKFKEAVAVFQEVKRLDPNFQNLQADLKLAQNYLSFYSHVNQADRLIRRGLVEPARKELQMANKFAKNKELNEKLNEEFTGLDEKEEIIAKENELESLYRQGISQLQQKNWLKAISLFTKIIIIDPNYRDVSMLNQQARIGFYLVDGVEKISRNQWVDALTAYQALLKIDPQNEEALKAIQQLSEKKDSVTVDLHLRRAEDAVNFQDIQAARRNFEKVLQIDPQNAEAIEGLKKITAVTESFTNVDTSEISLDKQKLIKLGGAAFAAVLIVVLLIRVLRPGKILAHYRKLRDFDKTRVVYERILDSDPQRRIIYPSLASIYRQLKIKDKLPTLIDICRQQKVEATPREAPLWQLCLGEIYLATEEPQQALEEIEKAYEMAPGREEIKGKLIKVYKLLLKEYPENSTWQERLVQLGEKQSTDAWLPIADKLHGQNIAKMDEEAKRSLLKECFGRKKIRNSESEQTITQNTKPKIHQAAS